MNGCVVLVEDDPDQRRILRLYLEHEGYTVVEAGDGPSAISEIRTHDPVAVLLDVMLPLLNGRDVCRVIRAESDVPIIMVTARGVEGDVTAGLDDGADDYVVKPYRPRELMARVRAAVRRHDTGPGASATIRYADLTVDLDRRTVHRGTVEVALTASEFDILVALLERPGRVWTRAQLISRVAAYRGVGMERTIDTHVRNVRRKLGDDAAAPRYVSTVVGVGYRTP